MLSGTGLCDESIIRPGESYRLWCVVVCDLETSRMRRPRPALGRSATGGKNTSNNPGLQGVHRELVLSNSSFTNHPTLDALYIHIYPEITALDFRLWG